MQFATLLVVLLAVAPPPPAAASPAIAATQGGLVFGDARRDFGQDCATLRLNGLPVRLGADGRYLIGFGRDAAASSMLVCEGEGGTATRLVMVAPRNWRVQSLPGLPPHPVPDAEYAARRPAERAAIAAARAVPSDLTGWRGAFVRPAAGPVTSVFGSQRILAGEPQSPHSGIDIGAPAGTPVVAPASGIVRLAGGPFTLEGNLVLIDHGFGLMSALMHLSRIDVRVGQHVAAGDLVGQVGATGRATGPHLHWGLTWTPVVTTTVGVDPAPLLDRR